MIVLLSPAKSLDFETDHNLVDTTKGLFLNDAEYLVKKLEKKSARQLKKMMGISDELAELNWERYQTWTPNITPENGKPAAFAFNGDVYQGLEISSFTQDDLAFAQEHIRILSGLYGVLRPLDLMLPYRLEMGTSWAVTPAKNNLYKYWQKKLTECIQAELNRTGAKFVLNLASQEYAKAVQLKKLNVPVVTPDFKEEKGGEYKMISFFAKKARGLMARYATQNRVTEIDQLKDFDLDGYSLNLALSDLENNKWIYTRKSK